jgi:hypothetical protein
VLDGVAAALLIEVLDQSAMLHVQATLRGLATQHNVRLRMITHPGGCLEIAHVSSRLATLSM